LTLFTAATQQCSGAAADGDVEIPEITVTATRREESLQRVPVAVSVLSGAEMAARNFASLQDVSAIVPVLEFRTGASSKDRDVFIRGIGTITTSPGVEPSVSTVVDGVVFARPGQATVELLDVDRIEVLRGPQGTLFGKNASAGVVNIVTSDPLPEARGYAEGSYFGGGDEYRFKSGMSGGVIGDEILGSLSAVYSRYAGNVTDLADGATLNGYERYGAHAKLVVKSFDSLRLTFNADYMHSADTVPTGVPASSSQVATHGGIANQNAPFAAALANSGLDPSFSSRTVSQNVNSSDTDGNGGVGATLVYAHGDYALTSITAWRHWLNEQAQDYDQISQLSPTLPQIADYGNLSFDQFSEELRLASPKGSFVDYQVGGYYMRAVDRETYQRDELQLNTTGPSASNGISHFGTQASNYSIFGEANLNFTAALRAILGARVVRDTLDYHLARVTTSMLPLPAIAPAFSSGGSTGDYGYADRAGLQYDFDRDLDAYITYSRGYTGPAYNVYFNMGPTATNALRPQSSNSYEAGFKTRMLDERLQLNMALFWTVFANYQANFPDVVGGTLVTRLINAGTVSTRGIESELTVRPSKALTLGASGAWTRARVDDFNCPPQASSSCDINGQPLPFAPDWKINTEGTYSVSAGGGRALTFSADYHWQSRVQYQLTEAPDTVQGAYGILDAGLALSDDLHGWTVRALVKNVLNKNYSEFLAHGDLAGVMRWVPRDATRYAGVEVLKTFGR
jgi:iron complex outermembrane receptor protein